MPDYHKIGSEVGALVKEKNAAYGDSFGRAQEVLSTLYPNGIQPEQYQDMFKLAKIGIKELILKQKDVLSKH